MSLKGSNYPTVRPSLDLQFAQTKRLDPRISYSRSGVATYYDETGILRTAQAHQARFDHDPTTGESLGLLVEEARTNFATRSDDFVTDSTNTNVTVIPNSAVAPDGKFTATKIIDNSTNAEHYVQHPAVNGIVQTNSVHSIFAKAAELDTFELRTQNTTTIARFTLSGDGTATPISGVTSASIEKYPNGWYKCSYVASFVATVTNPRIALYNGAQSYVGDGSGIYVWGLQFENQVTFGTSYIPTPATFTSRSTTATYYDANGVIQTAGIDVARDNAYFPDENGVMRPAGLLLEAAGTNLITQSEVFLQSDAYRLTVTANNTTAPDNTNTADKLVPTTEENTHFVYLSNAFTTTANKSYTYSVFIKPSGYSQILLSMDGASGDGQFTASAIFNLATQTTSDLTFNAYQASIQKLPTGWYRCAMSATIDSSVGASPLLYVLDNTGALSYAGDGTSGVFAWGAQIEESPYPTSYIPTTGSTVTRAADVSSSSTVTRSADVAQITGANFSSWYNQSEGSFVLDERNSYGVGQALRFELNQDSSPNSNAIAFTVNYNNGTRISSKDSNTTGSIDRNLANVWTQGGSHKYAYGLEQDNFSIVSGVNSATDTSGTFPPNLDSLSFGGASARATTLSNPCGKFLISRLTYYPVHLPDATLQKITQ